MQGLIFSDKCVNRKISLIMNRKLGACVLD